MKLRCIAPYRNDARGLAYTYGQIIAGDDALIEFLRRDAPGCFDVAVEPKAAKPAEDKAVKSAANKGIL